MADWIFDQRGKATLIADGERIRDGKGAVVGWLRGINAYALSGHHVGWYEDGVLYDDRNCVLGFTRSATGYLPSRPGLGGIPGTPGFTGIPGKPGFSGVPGRPGRGGWSSRLLADYFDKS